VAGCCPYNPSNITRSGSCKKLRSGLKLIWKTVIWKARNDRLFNSRVLSAIEVVDKIKVLVWCWYLGRMTKTLCLFYEWSWNPINCLARLLQRFSGQVAEALIAYVTVNWVSVGLLLSQFIFDLGMPFCFVSVPCYVLVAGCFFELGVYLLLGILLSAMLQFV